MTAILSNSERRNLSYFGRNVKGYNKKHPFLGGKEAGEAEEVGEVKKLTIHFCNK
ncbi:hypothetical protein HY771_03325 [Candidatus Uhrbacteria bacterium]|nr:hypothetical protein [Candidatus Uhrbacteria bacterium]